MTVKPDLVGSLLFLGAGAAGAAMSLKFDERRSAETKSPEGGGVSQGMSRSGRNS